MGRLIDADVFKQQMSALALTSPAMFTHKVVKLLEIIDKQPTAYNVEAVLKEVKEIGVGFCDSVECCDGCDDCEQGSLMRAILDAIRKGGVK